MKMFRHKKELIRRRNLKDSADDFIQGQQDKMNLNSDESISDQSEYLKKKFMKRKNNLSSYLPPEKENSKEKFKKLGSFKTSVGPVSVGFEKFKPNSKLRFTLLSNEEKDFNDKNSRMDFQNDHNYFKKRYKNGKDKFQENATTLEFDPREKTLKKVYEVFSDDIQNDDDEVLYDDALEETEIEEIKEKSKFLNPNSLNDAITDLKTIKNEKMADNKEFKSYIEEFSKLYHKNKLKKIEDSDQVRVAQKRLYLSTVDVLLQKRMKEIFNLRKKFYLIIKSMLSKNLKPKGVE